MDSQAYWQRHQLERERKWHELTTSELRTLKRFYQKSCAEIEKEIAALYAKFARENALPPEEARRLIRGREFKQWRFTLEEYVKRSKLDLKILRELNTLAARSRISRLEAIHATTLMELADLAERLQETMDAHLARAYLDTYYRNLYDFHKTVGLVTPPAQLDAKRVESVLQTAWVGKNYSARIWNNRTKLVREIKQTMLTAIHRGSSIQQLSKALARRMEVGYNDAERLVRTELNAVENRASADAMRDAEFEYYQFVATLDRRTCARCGEHDGEIYRLTEMHQGENAPPLHARCRCTIVATDDAPNARHKPAGERAARDYGNNPKTKSFAETISSLGGKGGERGKGGEPSHVKTPFGTVNVGGKFDFPKASGEPKSRRKRVPADMTYTQWKAIYIDKTKTFAQWQAEMDAKYAAATPTKEQLRGREIIEQLAAGKLPSKSSDGKISLRGLAAGERTINFGEGGKPPRLIGNIDPKDMAQVKQAVSWFESVAVHAPVENAMVITTTGEVYHCSGGLNTLTTIAKLGEKLHKAIVTHNHPRDSVNEYSFSDDDIRLFMEFNLSILRGVDEFFIYEFNRDSNFLDEANIAKDPHNYKHWDNIRKAKARGIGYRRWSREPN